MALQRVQQFCIERIRLSELINESTQFLQRVYHKEEFDPQLDPLTYKLESERLLKLIRDAENLYVENGDLLKEFHDEVRYGFKLIEGALDILNSAPSRFQERRKIVPESNFIKSSEVKVLQPCSFQVVSCQTVEKRQFCFVREKPKVFVIPKLNIVTTEHAEVIPPCHEEVVSCKVEKLSNVIIKEQCNKVQTQICKSVVVENIETVVVQKQPKVQLIRNDVIGSHHVNATNTFKSSDFDNGICDDYQMVETFAVKVQIEELYDCDVDPYFGKRTTPFMFWNSYNRVCLRNFWVYFMFSDFSLESILFLCVKLFVLVFGHFIFHFSVVKIFNLDGGECYCCSGQ